MPAAYPGAIDPLGDLHCRYEGALPRRARQEALAGGKAALQAMRADAARRLLADQCAGARLAVARRRAMLTGGHCRRDRWLARLVAELTLARTNAMRAWHHRP